MPEIIAGVLITFLAAVGLTELWCYIKKYVYEPTGQKAAFVVTCSGHDEKIEYYVRALANQASDLRFYGDRLVVIIDAGMDDETRAICEKLEKDISGVTVCKMSDLPYIFGGQLQN